MKTIYAYFFILLGDIFLALGLDMFLLPNKLSTGGFSGLATIISTYMAMPIGTIIVLLNVLLIIYAYILFGFRFITRTTLSIIFFGVFANYFESMYVVTNDLLLSSLCGGMLVGLGVGLNIKFFSTTGGSELLAKILQKYFKGIKISSFVFIIDAVIVALFVMVFKNIDVGLYSIVAIFASTKTIDVVIEGISSSFAVYIISNKVDEISEEISKNLARGITIINSEGYYSKVKNNMIYCVVTKYELEELKEIIRKIDRTSFVVINQVKEVLGYGFEKVGS